MEAKRRKNFQSLVGQRFGRWIILADMGSEYGRGEAMWNCLCDCGNKKVVRSSCLRSGESRSCGCLQKTTIYGEDHTGKKFGRWTVLKRAERKHRRITFWVCRCECGTERDVAIRGIISGRSTSCGCYAKEARRAGIIEKVTTHGKSRTTEYQTWCSIIARCHRKTSTGYKSYGAKGIAVCDRWREDFQNFYDDMGERPSEYHSIDRFPDTKGNYEPGNCRWATRQQQDENRGKFYEINGERLNVSQIAKKYNVSTDTIRVRVDRLGWTIERAISIPVDTTRGPRKAGSPSKTMSQAQSLEHRISVLDKTIAASEKSLNIMNEDRRRLRDELADERHR